MVIWCKRSQKSGKKYLVLIYKDIFVSFDRMVIEKVAMTAGISNIVLESMEIDDKIEI